jgi:hypothetical protein
MNIVLLKTLKRTKNVLVWQFKWLLVIGILVGDFAVSECLKVAFKSCSFVLFVVLRKYFLSLVGF